MSHLLPLAPEACRSGGMGMKGPSLHKVVAGIHSQVRAWSRSHGAGWTTLRCLLSLGLWGGAKGRDVCVKRGLDCSRIKSETRYPKDQNSSGKNGPMWGGKVPRSQSQGRDSGEASAGAAHPHGHEGGLHETATAIVVVGIKTQPNEGEQPDHARQQHKFSHGREKDAANVAAFSAKSVAFDAGSPPIASPHRLDGGRTLMS